MNQLLTHATSRSPQYFFFTSGLTSSCLPHRLASLSLSVAMLVTSALLVAQPAHAGIDDIESFSLSPCTPEGKLPENATQGPVRELAVGGRKVVTNLCPAEKYFPSGVLLTPGATYHISAQGLWRDSWIDCGPNGWGLLPLQIGNRLRWRRFFLLSASVGQNLTHFLGTQ